MSLIDQLRERKLNLRIDVVAKQILDRCSKEELDYILDVAQRERLSILDEKTVKSILANRKDIEVKKSIQVPAKDTDPKVEVDRSLTYDPSIYRTRSTIDDFISLYRSRFRAISRLFSRETDDKVIEIDNYEDLNTSNHQNQEISVIGMVFRKSLSKNENLVLDLEIASPDFQSFGQRKFVVVKDNPNYKEYRDNILEDDIIRVRAKWTGNIGLVRDISYPDLNMSHPFPNIQEDISIMYISDLHFGSKHVNHRAIRNLLTFLNSPTNPTSNRIKYLVIIGDNVEGIGVYPGQERELEIVDIEKQYREFNRFLEEIPDHIEVIFIPGNHDATRRNEPTELILEDLIWTDSYSLPNPVYVKIHGVDHLIYHGTSLDSYINTIPGMNYEDAKRAAIEILKRRHLSSIVNGNPVAPMNEDFLVIRRLPHVLNLGHVHKAFAVNYRKTYVFNPGTFQNQ
ncbi:MAG: metallophosphoesterase, partial [Candidatus Micrarchaeota archaeon]|nr:metallophosphoesterase [Candidatus Micrarchaeota archaeon]